MLEVPNAVNEVNEHDVLRELLNRNGNEDARILIALMILLYSKKHYTVPEIVNFLNFHNDGTPIWPANHATAPLRTVEFITDFLTVAGFIPAVVPAQNHIEAGAEL